MNEHYMFGMCSASRISPLKWLTFQLLPLTGMERRGGAGEPAVVGEAPGRTFATLLDFQTL